MKQAMGQLRASVLSMLDAVRGRTAATDWAELELALVEVEKVVGQLEADAPLDRLPNDHRTAADLDAHLREKGVRSVLTKLADVGGTVQVTAELRDTPSRMDAFGPTSSEAFDNLLTKLDAR